MVRKSKESKNIGIVGLGLIGGSLSLDLQRIGYRVHGLTHRQETVQKAKQRSLGQVISTDPNILKNCSIIILALPLEQLLNPEPELIHAIPQDAVVTDVGSVKSPVLKTWRNLHPRFVASHPMAGNHKSGIEAGEENLFIQKPWVVTPESQTDKTALAIVHNLVLSIGSKWITTNADLHDEAVGLISHLPVFVSAALIKTIGDTKNPSISQLAKDLASSGFVDTTRVGGGNAALGISMAKNNKLNMLKTIQNYKKSLEFIEEKIISENWTYLEEELQSTQEIRTEFINNLF